MAIAYQATVQSFGGTASYLESGRHGRANPVDRVDWIESRNLGGTEDPHLAAKFMDATAAQNSRVEKGGYHFSVSFHPEDRSQLDQTTMSRFADQVLERLDLQDHQALIVAHKDTSHPHFHVLVNRVHPENLKAWDRWQDRPRMQESLRRLELEHGLRQTPGYLYQLPGQEPPNPEKSRTIAEARRGREAFADVLKQRGIDKELKAATSWRDLEARLDREELSLKKAGRGLQLTDGKQTAKPSRLHRMSSLGHLEKRFGQTYADHKAQKRREATKKPQATPKTTAKTPKAAQQATRAHAEHLPTDQGWSDYYEREAEYNRTLEDPTPSSASSAPATAAKPPDPDRLREALSRLEKWDRLNTKSQQLQQQRSSLEYGGDIPAIEERLRQNQPLRLANIYRDPESANASIQKSYSDEGREATWRHLANQPQDFGQLHGRRILGVETQPRAEALQHANATAQNALEQHRRKNKLRRDLERAKTYRRRQQTLSDQRRQIQITPAQIRDLEVRLQGHPRVTRIRATHEPHRHILVADVGRKAEGLEDLRKLTPNQRSILQQIQNDERNHLKPLRREIDKARPDAAEKFQSLSRQVTKTNRHRRELTDKLAAAKKVARRIGSLYVKAPIHIALRLAPTPARIAVQAVKLSRALSRAIDRGPSR